MPKPIVHHIPVCPFCQRLEILLTLKGCPDAVEFHVVDITRPRPDWLLQKTRGTTAMPILELPDGRILKESLVLMRYLDEVLPGRPVAHPAAQQVTREEVVKLYYDYSQGAGNGALLPGRRRSSFTFDPDWRTRPWPPRNKYEHNANDAELGL